MPTYYTGSHKIQVRSKEELDVVLGSPTVVARCITKLVYVNNDTISHTPDFRVRTSNQAKIQAGDEYVRLPLPKRAVAAGGVIDLAQAPILPLDSDERYVVEHLVDPTNELWPTILVVWLDELQTPLP